MEQRASAHTPPIHGSNNPLIHQSLYPVKTMTPPLHHSTTPFPTVRLFASARSWIEDEALRQLYAAAKLEGVRSAVGFLAGHDLESTDFDSALGTIGGGNHFAELQAVEEVLDAGTFKEFGLGEQQLAVLVHSGSRGPGAFILRAHAVHT